jgi:hypothetical protein
MMALMMMMMCFFLPYMLASSVLLQSNSDISQSVCPISLNNESVVLQKVFFHIFNRIHK